MDKWLQNHNVVRVISLILGILLWAVVHMDQQPAQTTPADNSPQIREQSLEDVAVEVVGLDDAQFSVRSMSVKTVQLTLRGKNADLLKVSPYTAKIQLDLSHAIKGTREYPLHAVGFPDNVEVTMKPAVATVTIEEKVKKEMAVDVTLAGDPANGFQAGTPIIRPSRVHVTAPTSVLEAIKSIGAEVDVSGASAAVDKEVKLVAYKGDGKAVNAEITPSVVEVEVPITSPFKSMPLQIKLLGHLPAGHSVATYNQSVKNVTVYGPRDLLDKMDFYDGLQIDLSNITSDKEFSMDIPVKDGIVSVDPPKVDVQMHVVPSETKTFDHVKIAITGQNNDYDTSVTDPAGGEINLTLEGAPNVLDKVKPEDFQAIVDVSNLSPGTHKVPLIVNLPPFVKLSGESDIQATVDIREKPASETSPSSPGPGAGTPQTP